MRDVRVIRKIDVEEKFRRQILPSSPEKVLSIPLIQRPVPTIPEPSSKMPAPPPLEFTKPIIQPPDDSPLPLGDKKVGVIAQEGTFKRAADIKAVKKLIERQKVSVVAKPGKIIDVAEKFKRQDLPSKAILQTPGYTAYALGEKKKGLVSQLGLLKREEDKEVLKKNVGIKAVASPVAVGEDKPVQNVGVLKMFDQFFNWLNKVIGE